MPTTPLTPSAPCVAGDDYGPQPDVPPQPAKTRHASTRDAALAAPDLWHRLAVPPTPKANAEWRAAEVRRGRGVWAREAWHARVVEVEGGFAVYVRPAPAEPAAVTS